MSAEVQRRCMEPFFTTKARSISTGMGVPLVFGLVREAGGTVDLKSEEGRGTTFTLTLRRVHTRSAAAAGPKRRALVGMRDAKVRAFGTTHLEVLGYEVAYDGAAAAADLVVVDDAGRQPRGHAKVLVLDEPGTVGEGAVAIGRSPQVKALREAIWRLAGRS